MINPEDMTWKNVFEEFKKTLTLGHGFPDQRCETAGLDADGMCRGLASVVNYDEPWELCKTCEYYGGESDDVWVGKPRNHSKEKRNELG